MEAATDQFRRESVRVGPAAAASLGLPGGWFAVATSEELLPGRALNRRFMSEDIVVYRTATGKAAGALATWTVSYPISTGGGYAPPTPNCSSMALDPSGRFLLVPYLATPGNPAETSTGSLTAARINTATGARSDWTISYGAGQIQGAMSIAW